MGEGAGGGGDIQIYLYISCWLQSDINKQWIRQQLLPVTEDHLRRAGQKQFRYNKKPLYKNLPGQLSWSEWYA